MRPSAVEPSDETAVQAATLAVVSEVIQKEKEKDQLSCFWTPVPQKLGGHKYVLS